MSAERNTNEPHDVRVLSRRGLLLGTAAAVASATPAAAAPKRDGPRISLPKKNATVGADFIALGSFGRHTFKIEPKLTKTGSTTVIPYKQILIVKHSGKKMWKLVYRGVAAGDYKLVVTGIRRNSNPINNPTERMFTVGADKAKLDAGFSIDWPGNGDEIPTGFSPFGTLEAGKYIASAIVTDDLETEYDPVIIFNDTQYNYYWIEFALPEDLDRIYKLDVTSSDLNIDTRNELAIDDPND